MYKSEGGNPMLVSVYYEHMPVILNESLTGINYRYIDGSIRNRKFCAGFCNFENHRGCLNEKMMKTHKCHEKQCVHLFSDALDVEICNRKTKAHKKRIECCSADEIMKTCSSAVNPQEGLKIIKATSCNKNSLRLEYVAVCSVDEISIKQRIEKLTNCSVEMIQRKCNFDTAVALFCDRSAH